MPEQKKDVERATPKRRPALRRRLPPAGKVQTLLAVVRAAVEASSDGKKPVMYRDVSGVAGMHETFVSACLAFLREAGLLRKEGGRGRYVPTEASSEFVRQSEWDEEAARSELRAPLQASWFGTLATQHVRAATGPVPPENLVSVLGKEAGAPGSERAAVRTLVELLDYGHVLQPADGGYVTDRNGRSGAGGREPQGRLGDSRLLVDDGSPGEDNRLQVLPGDLGTAARRHILDVGGLRFDLRELSSQQLDEVIGIVKAVHRVVSLPGGEPETDRPVQDTDGPERAD